MGGVSFGATSGDEKKTCYGFQKDSSKKKTDRIVAIVLLLLFFLGFVVWFASDTERGQRVVSRAFGRRQG